MSPIQYASNATTIGLTIVRGTVSIVVVCFFCPAWWDICFCCDGSFAETNELFFSRRDTTFVLVTKYLLLLLLLIFVWRTPTSPYCVNKWHKQSAESTVSPLIYFVSWNRKTITITARLRNKLHVENILVQKMPGSFCRSRHTNRILCALSFRRCGFNSAKNVSYFNKSLKIFFQGVCWTMLTHTSCY